MKGSITIALALILTPAGPVLTPHAQGPEEITLRLLEADGTIGRRVRGGILHGDGGFSPRAEGVVYLRDGTLAFERAGFLILPDGGAISVFSPNRGSKEVRDENGKRYRIPPGFHLEKDTDSGRHFVVPEGGAVVRDREGRYHVLPPDARLEYDGRGRPFIVPAGTHLEKDADGRGFVVPDGGRLERDGNGRTIVVPPGLRSFSTISEGLTWFRRACASSFSPRRPGRPVTWFSRPGRRW